MMTALRALFCFFLMSRVFSTESEINGREKNDELSAEKVATEELGKLNVTTSEELYPNESSTKMFRDVNNVISWKDPDELIPSETKQKIEFSLKHKGEEMSGLLFDCIAYHWRDVSEKAAPFLKEILSDLSENVDLDARNNHRVTVLMHAVYFDAKEAAERLIERGANVHATDKKGNSALHFAWGSESCCRLLLKNGANVNHQTRHGKTALMFSTDHGCNNVVELLLMSGADGSMKDENDNTALMEAAQHERVEIVNILLKFNVNTQTQNKSKFTALDVAAKKCSELIRDYEATNMKRKRNSKMQSDRKY